MNALYFVRGIFERTQIKGPESSRVSAIQIAHWQRKAEVSKVVRPARLVHSCQRTRHGQKHIFSHNPSRSLALSITFLIAVPPYKYILGRAISRSLSMVILYHEREETRDKTIFFPKSSTKDDNHVNNDPSLGFFARAYGRSRKHSPYLSP